MKRALLVVALVIVAIGGVDVLGDLTQTRPDRVARGSRSEIVFEVRNRDGRTTPRMAEGLWGACQGNVWQSVVEPGVQFLGGERFQLVTEPALGEHAWRRLQGCLDDLTLDRVKANVVSKRDLPPPAPR